MPTFNNNDLISAALRSGQLKINSDRIEFPVKTSNRFKRVITDEFLTGEQSTKLDQFNSQNKFKIPVEKIDRNGQNNISRILERQKAQEELKKAWERSGGAFSPVGLPIDPTSISEISPGKWALQCRSGYIQYVHQNRETHQVVTSKVTVRLVAIECQMRQESSDEVYGVIAVHGPANRLIHSVRVPSGSYLSMGKPGARLTFPQIPIVTDVPVEDLYIRVAWIENDSGNIEDIAQKVSAKLSQAAAALVGGLVGAGAESVASSQDETFYEASLWVVGNVLGMGDDAYPVEGKYISAGELMGGSGPRLQGTYQRKDDPRPVERWTHDIVARGVDDGGDIGSYRFFFEVFRTDFLSTKPI